MKSSRVRLQGKLTAFPGSLANSPYFNTLHVRTAPSCCSQARLIIRLLELLVICNLVFGNPRDAYSEFFFNLNRRFGC